MSYDFFMSLCLFVIAINILQLKKDAPIYILIADLATLIVLIASFIALK